MASNSHVSDSGSNYQYYDQEIVSHPPRSVFDLSYLHSTTMNEGMLVPVAVWEALPNSDYELSNQLLIRVSPMVVPMLTRLRAFVHYYYVPYSNLWKNWQPFYSKGLSGKFVASLPSSSLGEGVDHATDLAGYLGLTHVESAGGNNHRFNVLSLFAYQLIYRDYYMNKNLFINDTTWFPPDDRDFILSVSGGHVAFEACTTSGLALRELFVLRYRNWLDDYFTSAMPWPVRGNEVGISLDGTIAGNVSLPVKTPSVTNDLAHSVVSALNGTNQILHGTQAPGTSFSINFGGTGSNSSLYLQPNSQIGTASGSVSLSASGFGSITIDMLRQLNAAQLMMEKMARTDGTYLEFMRSFFGTSPRTATVRRPVYIGGTVQPIVVSEVLQTSQTNDDSPLGDEAGHGISSGSGYVGKIHSDEYGIILGIMSIMPDAMYHQGLDRMFWHDLTQEDYYLPLRAQLGPQAILEKEIYNTGVGSSSEMTGDYTVFGYQGRFDHYRYRSNRISGLLGNPANAYYFGWTMSRHFTSAPTLSQSFVSTEGTIRDDVYFAPSDPHFIVQIANRCRAVQPLPYKNVPEGLF